MYELDVYVSPLNEQRVLPALAATNGDMHAEQIVAPAADVKYPIAQGIQAELDEYLPAGQMVHANPDGACPNGHALTDTLVIDTG